MSATTMNIDGVTRFVRRVSNGTSMSKYSYHAMQQANAKALQSAKWTEAKCKVAEVSNTVNKLTLTDGVFDEDTGKWTTLPTYTAWCGDEYDAYKQAGDLVKANATFCGYAGCVAYRYKMPTSYKSSATANVTHLVLPINRDRYCKDGVRVAVAFSNSSAPSDDWATIRGDASGAIVTDGYLAQTATNLLAGRAASGGLAFDSTTYAAYSTTTSYAVGDNCQVGTKAYVCTTAITASASDPHEWDDEEWSPVDDYVHIADLATATRYDYVYVYITLEDYDDCWEWYSEVEARNYYIEGSAMLVSSGVLFTFADTVTADTTPSNIYAITTDHVYQSLEGSTTPNVYFATVTHNGDMLAIGGLSGAISKIISQGGVVKHVFPIYGGTGPDGTVTNYLICGSKFTGTFTDLPGLLFYNATDDVAPITNLAVGVNGSVAQALAAGTAWVAGAFVYTASVSSLGVVANFMPVVNFGSGASIPMPFDGGSYIHSTTATVTIDTLDDVEGCDVSLVLPGSDVVDYVIPRARVNVIIANNIKSCGTTFDALAVTHPDASGNYKVYLAGAFVNLNGTYYHSLFGTWDASSSAYVYSTGCYRFPASGISVSGNGNVSVDHPDTVTYNPDGSSWVDKYEYAFVVSNPSGQSSRVCAAINPTGGSKTEWTGVGTPTETSILILDGSITGSLKFVTPQIGVALAANNYVVCLGAGQYPRRIENGSVVVTGYDEGGVCLWEDTNALKAIGVTLDSASANVAVVEPRLENRGSSSIDWTTADIGLRAIKGTLRANGFTGFRESASQRGLIFAISKRTDRLASSGAACGVVQVTATPLVMRFGCPTAYNATKLRLKWASAQMAYVRAGAVVHVYLAKDKFATTFGELAAANMWLGDEVSGYTHVGDFTPYGMTPVSGVYTQDFAIDLTSEYATLVLTASVNMDGVNLYDDGGTSIPAGIGNASMSLAGTGSAANLTTGFAPDVYLLR